MCHGLLFPFQRLVLELVLWQGIKNSVINIIYFFFFFLLLIFSKEKKLKVSHVVGIHWPPN